MTPSILKLDGVSKTFGGLRARSEVSLEVHAGEVVGAMGANGAGKTTLFSLIGGHARPGAGDIRLDDRSIIDLSHDRICWRGSARTCQIVRPFHGSTRSRRCRARKARPQALRFCGGEGDRHRCAGNRGPRGTVGPCRVADAAGQEAPLIAPAVLLDEVMAGLTPAEVNDMLVIVTGLRQRHGLTIVMIEHVMRALMQVSGRILVLQRIAVGPPPAIADDRRVCACYLGGRA